MSPFLNREEKKLLLNKIILMKTLNIIIIIILFASLAFSQTAQCNLNIDEINTKVYTRDNNYVYKSLVRHTPPRGNDDDAHNVTIQIIIPPNSTFLPPAKAYMNNGEVGTTSFDGHTVTITGIYIPRDEHVDVEIMVTNPCTQESNSEYSFIITAFPGYPFDIDLSDNQYVYTKQCP